MVEIITYDEKIDKNKIIHNLFRNNKTLCKLFGVVYCYEPLSITQSQLQFNQTFGIPINKGSISQYFTKLVSLGILRVESYSNIIISKNENKVHTSIKKKHFDYINSSAIPSNLKNAQQINDIKYFYTTELGKKFINEVQERGGYQLK